MDLEKNIVLIGGTSHTGKSTLATFLAQKSGLKNISTDTLARHPGRPWKERPEEIPLHVQEHYFNLSVNELIADVVKHYEKIWPIVQSVIEKNANGLILEGSALLPKLIEKISSKKITAIWVTANNAFLKDRIYKSSNYFKKSTREKYLIDKFVERTIAFNDLILKEAKSFKFPVVEVQNYINIEDLSNDSIQLLRKRQAG